MATDTVATEPVSNPIRREAARWAERLYDGNLAPAERQMFQRWLLTDESHLREFRAHNIILNLARDLPADVRGEMLPWVTEDARARGRERTVWLTGLAATFLVTLSLVGWLAYRNEAASIPLATSAQATRDVALPDGSIAHLNIRTDLLWLGGSDERRVALRKGEALFEVRHDPSRPFTVVLDDSEIQVLGTRFNVRRRRNAEVVVTVLEGTVRVSRVGSGQQTWTRTLHANEQIVYDGTGLLRDVRPATGANAALWRQGILEFEDEPLSNVIEDLGRYSDRQIVVRDPRLAQLRLGGQLNVHDSIVASLALLEKLAPVAAHESGDTFVLDYRQDPALRNH